MTNQNPAWLDESHPNYLRWKLARELSIERGKFVYSIVNQKVNSNNLFVLDLGSGEGGTSAVFSKNNFVVSLDLSLIRLQRQKINIIPKELNTRTELNNSHFSHFDPDLSGEKSEYQNVKDFSVESTAADFEMTTTNNSNTFPKINGNALQLPFTNNSFDLIIIQDVIEHLTKVTGFYSEVKRLLKNNGAIYLSTPNKYSIFNVIADPHFALPIVSILKRESIKKYFLKYFRKDDYNRTDIAQLLFLTEITNIFCNDFQISLHTKFSVQELINGNKGIVWSDFHLKLIAFCKIIKLDRLLIKIANDNFGVLNKYFTPTFYFILSKK